MANPEHLKVLRQGVAAWNAWRQKTPGARPDLRQATFNLAKLQRINLDDADLTLTDFSNADLRKADISAVANAANFSKADLSGAVLSGSFLTANFHGANLTKALFYEAHVHRGNFSGANLTDTILIGAHLDDTNFRDAILIEADLSEASIRRADFTGADMRGANLRWARMDRTDLSNANVSACHVYGISAWGLRLSERTKQQNLIITLPSEPEVIADDIEVAQFLHLMLYNDKIRRIIDTITSKVVLILGRFTPKRKPVLDALRDALRKPERGYVPVVFDFEKSQSHTVIETVGLLARMARFVIADLTDAKGVLQELQSFVPTSPRLPVQPLISAGQDMPGTFDAIESYPWVCKAYRYHDLAKLLTSLDERVIRPVEAKVLELRGTSP